MPPAAAAGLSVVISASPQVMVDWLYPPGSTLPPPRMNPEGGRDHWGNVFSVAFAGGGLKTGQAVGKSNARGEYPVDRPLSPQDVTATVFHHLGIDASKVAFPDQTGRPIYLVEDGEPIRELVE